MNNHLANLDRTRKSFPEGTVSWYEQGRALANLGKYVEALDCFDRAVLRCPDDPELWVFRGVTLIYLEQYEAALTSCDRALSISPTDPEAWVFRGVALQRLGRYRESYNSYDQALGNGEQSFWLTMLHSLQMMGNRIWKALGLIHAPN
jgi:Flp pilus assembly protein TadD